MPGTSAVTGIAGSLFLAGAFNFMLYGVLIIQIYMYSTAFPHDSLGVKALVAFIYAVETTQTVLILSSDFGYFAKGFADVQSLNDVGTSWFSLPIATALVSFSVQMFFIYRIWALSKSKCICTMIASLSLASTSGHVFVGARMLQHNRFDSLQSLIFVPTTIALLGSALCDIIIAAVMTFYICKRKTIFSEIDVIIPRLIRLVIEAGICTATVATLVVVIWLAFPHAAYYLVPASVLAKLYSNTCLVILNSRFRIVGRQENMQDLGAISSKNISCVDSAHPRSCALPSVIHIHQGGPTIYNS